MANEDYILRSDALKAILGLSIYDTLDELDGARTISENTWADGLYDAYKIIEEEVDYADVEPVRYGRWIQNKERFGMYFCAACGDEWGSAAKGIPMRYCPNCGAKMMTDDEIADGIGQAFSPD